MRLRNPPPDDSKRNIFVQGLVAAVQEKRDRGAAEHAARDKGGLPAQAVGTETA
jgi:hypothetical protein